jgi:hypothetical protein
MGNAVGGTCLGATCSHPTGGSALSEYSVGLTYANQDEDFEGGVQMIRRVADAQSDSLWINHNNTPVATTTPTGGMNMTIWDIYAKKKAGKFDFGVEAPIFNGSLVGYSYKAFALALDAKYRASDAWSFLVKAGKVPGQRNSNSNVGGASGVTVPEKWTMVYLHPNYKLGLLMFNYNFANFAGNNNPNNTATGDVKSIYDAPITNANYLMLGTTLTADKWRVSGSFITAKANETASSGQYFFNTLTRSYSTVTASHDQSSSLGSEFDLGVALDWDEFTTFALDFGLYMPGGFYKFGGAAGDTDLGTVFGAVGSIGVRF